MLWATKNDPVLLEYSKLVEIAAKYTKSVAQILIRCQICIDIISIGRNYAATFSTN